jgi:predicted Co/Zn/Cd cation transporter (cation efflux family)
MSFATTSQPSRMHSRRPRGFFRTAWRALKQLFHEMTGAMFALLALAALNSALRAWRNGSENWIVALPIAYALVMTYFAVTSFRFAKRVD